MQLSVLPKYIKVTLGICFFVGFLFIICLGPGEYLNLRIVPKSSISFNWWMKFSKNEERKHKQILVWTTYFRSQNWLPPLHDLHCPVSTCELTYDRQQIENSSALIMHLRDLDEKDLPDPKADGLLWVLLNREAPPQSPRKTMELLNGKVHWTITYRRDSEIFAPYGEVMPRSESFVSPDLNANRSLVCWLVSHCHTSSLRETFAKELSVHIPVQVYGRCYGKKCPENNTRNCYQWLAKRCKFYLSFENSICRDYATEKLYYALANDMVPIVLGGADYSNLLPNHSFINVADFDSPRHLAKFLKELDTDSVRYSEYFHWKRNLVPVNVDYMWLCDLCRKLQETEVVNVKAYKDLASWWFDDSSCKNWNEMLS